MNGAGVTVYGPYAPTPFELGVRVAANGQSGEWHVFPMDASEFLPAAQQVFFRLAARLEANGGLQALDAARARVVVRPLLLRPEESENGNTVRPCTGVRVEVVGPEERVLREEVFTTAQAVRGLAMGRGSLIAAAQGHPAGGDVQAVLLSETAKEGSDEARPPVEGGAFTSEPVMRLPPFVDWDGLGSQLGAMELVGLEPAASHLARVFVARRAVRRFQEAFRPDVEIGGFFLGSLALDARFPEAPVVLLGSYVESRAVASSQSGFAWSGVEMAELRESSPPDRQVMIPAHTHLAPAPEKTGERASVLFLSIRDCANHRMFFSGAHEVSVVGDASSPERELRFFGWDGDDLTPIAHRVFDGAL